MNRYYHPVRNFTSVDHKANNQSLCVFSDKRGIMYFGEALGLKVFDGLSWRVAETPARVYSGAVDSANTIFLGTESGFGFLEPDSKGKLRFQSLAPKNMPEDFGIFWYTICTPGKVYFVCRSVIFCYDYKTITSLRPENKFHKAFYCDGTLFVKELEGGLFYLKNDKFIPVPGSDIFKQARIEAIMPYHGDTLFLASRELGLMYFNYRSGSSDSASTFIPIQTPVNDMLRQAEINSGCSLPGMRYVFGTRKDGVYLTDAKGNLLSGFNHSNGLVNNLVWGLCPDAQHGLWMALDNGISRVEYDSPFEPIGPESGYSGNIETINKLGDQIYLGTTTGLFRASEKEMKFSRVGKISVPCWNIQSLSLPSGNMLLVASDAGLFQLDHQQQVKLIRAGNYYCVKPLNNTSELIVAGTLESLDFFKLVGDEVFYSYRIDEIDGEKQSIEEDEFGNLWIGTRDRGVLFVEGYDFGKSQNHAHAWLNESNGLPSIGENGVFRIQKRIYVSGFEGLFELQGNHKGLKAADVPGLKFTSSSWLPSDFYTDKMKDDTRQVWTMATDQEGRAHLSTRFKNNFEVIVANLPGFGKPHWESNTYKVLPNDQVRSVFHDRQGFSFLGGAEFLYRFDRKKILNTDAPSDCILRLLVSKSDTLFFGYAEAGSFNADPIDYDRELIFSYCNTFYSSNLDSEFRTFLEGEDDEWTGWSKNTSRSFSKLWPGNYTFKIQAKSPYGVIGKTTEFHFRITPPWYLTWWAFVAYFIIFTILLILIIKIYTIGLNRIIRNQTVEIVEQKNLIENKNKEITDSIWYAKRIQDAIMPARDYFSGLFPKSFILLKPKDIVSGDFYWATGRGYEKILVAADCTGHGVPGAFMSMMGNDYLNDIIIDKRITQPDEVLNALRAGIIKALKQKGEEGGSKDGMDVSLIRLNEQTGILDFAGANNPIYLIRSESNPAPDGFNSQMKFGDLVLYEFKGDKFPVGIHYGTGLLPFRCISIHVLPGDRFYLFSDGFADQFGGEDGKKLKNNQFKKLLLHSVDTNMTFQYETILRHFSQWKGALEQVDDVLVLGFEI